MKITLQGRIESEAKRLIEMSSRRDNIVYLLEHSGLGMRKFAGKSYAYANRMSNCHGTTLFALGLTKLERPAYVPPEYMRKFISQFCIEEKTNDGIVALYHEEGPLCHTAIYLGSGYCKDEIIFHQPNYGLKFEVSDLESAISHFSTTDARIVTKFFGLKHQEIVIPRAIRGN